MRVKWPCEKAEPALAPMCCLHLCSSFSLARLLAQGCVLRDALSTVQWTRKGKSKRHGHEVVRPMPVLPAVCCFTHPWLPSAWLPSLVFALRPQGWRGLGTPCATLPYKQALAQVCLSAQVGSRGVNLRCGLATLPHVISHAALYLCS